MSSSQRTHQKRLSYPLNNRTTTIRHWKQPTNWQHQEARIYQNRQVRTRDRSS